jgi:acetyltransferase-like isoleucine patch superfamily enzyme
VAVNRFHAFAIGVTFPEPERLGHLPIEHPHHALAKEVWANFRQAGNVSDEALLGVDAWVVNLLDDPARLKIGARSVVRGIIRIERRGYVSIADHCYVGDDVVISAHAGIDIEADVLIAHGVQIFDNVTHPPDADERARHYRAILAGEPYDAAIPASPIKIERNAWIGMNSIIMRGVHIGARAIVAAGSVVLDDVPPDATVGGNPARPVRHAAAEANRSAGPA